MPIYDQGYRRYEAREPLHQIRFWPITREALKLILSKRAFLGLLAVSFAPFLVRLVLMYASTRFPDLQQWLPVDGRVFGEFLNQQSDGLLIQGDDSIDGDVAADVVQRDGSLCRSRKVGAPVAVSKEP